MLLYLNKQNENNTPVTGLLVVKKAFLSEELKCSGFTGSYGWLAFLNTEIILFARDYQSMR